MEFRSFRSELQHFSGDKNLTLISLQSSEEANHFGQSARIRIVRVVDHHESFAKLDHLTAHSFGFHLADGVLDFFPGHTVRGADGDSGDSIGNIVLAEQRQNKIYIAPVMMQRECGAVDSEILNLLDSERG